MVAELCTFIPELMKVDGKKSDKKTGAVYK